ncbi:MAG: DUF2157 domain-containing protein [Planctomycetota bacterium]
MDFSARTFRNRLKRELPRWREEGLIDAQAEAALTERYHLGEDGISIAAGIIYTLGALLIGAGIISFVAWNWEHMSRPLKLFVLGASLVSAHGVGFWMWRVADVFPRLGHALTMLGTLIFGASIGLIAQMFHIHGDPAAAYGVWAIGATTAAWALLSVPNAVVGVVVACVWGCTHMGEHEGLLGIAPYLATVPFFGLLYFRPDRNLFVLISVSFVILVSVAISFGLHEPFGIPLGFVACAAALLAFSFEPYFGREARGLGVLALAFIAYLCSFLELAEELTPYPDTVKSYAWLALIVPLLAGAILLCVRHARRLRERPTTLCALVGVPIMLAALASGEGVIMAIAANLVLASMVFTSITSAARTLQRMPFWFGSALGGLVIVSRFLEFETDLWLKALVFLGCGIAVIVFGMGFERRLRRVD